MNNDMDKNDKESIGQENELSKLKNEVELLHNKLKDIESETWKEHFSPRNLRIAVEDILAESTLVKYGWNAAIGFLLLGIVVWLGGSIYSGITIKSLENRTNIVQREIKNINTEIAKLGEESREAIKKQASETNKKATEANKAIEDAKSGTINSFNNEKNKVTNEVSNSIGSIKTEAGNALKSIEKVIGEEKNKAIQRLDVKSLPNLAELKGQIAELQKTGGELNLWNIRRFVGYSWWIMLVTIPVTFMVSVIALYRTRKK